MNTEETVNYIEKFKSVIMEKGFPFLYSEFCDDHLPFRMVFQKHKNKLHKLYPILQVKDTHNVILYMNQYGRQVTTKGREGLPIYQLFGYLEPVV